MPLEPLVLSGTHLGCGAVQAKTGFYLLGTNFDGRYGGPGPREVVDLTGIAAGYRVVAMCRHLDVPLLATTNGTHTKIYQLATTWVEVTNIANEVAEPNGMISFKNVVAVAMGSGDAYRFSTDVTVDGTAYTFTASTKTAANAKYAHVFLGQVNGLTTPRVIYGFNPAASANTPPEIYFTEDLTNSDATGSSAPLIGDLNSGTNPITNLVEDYSGEVLICTRHDIYSMDSGGRVWRRTWENFPDPIADAGGQSDRKNFEAYAKLNGRIYFSLGYDILEWHRGTINKYFHPRHLSGGLIPRMNLPVNAMCEANGWIILALGSTNTGTLKGVAYAPGGNSSIANVFTTTSELYYGRYEEDTFVWHGIELLCTDPLRFMWYDEDTGYVYLASGASESANFQQRRFLFHPSNPFDQLSGSAVVLNTGTWQCEFGRIDFGSRFDVKQLLRGELDTIGLGVPTLAVATKLTSDYDTSAFTTDHTFSDNALAELGIEFNAYPRAQFRTMHLRLTGVGDSSGNTYPLFRELRLFAEAAAARTQPLRRR